MFGLPEDGCHLACVKSKFVNPCLKEESIRTSFMRVNNLLDIVCLPIDLVHLVSHKAMQGANTGVVLTEICLMTPVTQIANLNEFNKELKVRP